jgi:hypothetical protein
MNGKQEHTTAVLQEIVEAAGDPAATLESVYGKMAQLYETAKTEQDEGAMTVVSEAYTDMLALVNQTNKAIDIAAAARAVVDKITQQRDAIAQEHKTLVGDMINVNTDNRLVQRVYEAAEQDVHEDMIYSDTFFSECPACDIIENGNCLPVVHDVAGLFFDMLMGGYELTYKQREKLAGFITAFVREVENTEVISVRDENDLDAAS